MSLRILGRRQDGYHSLDSLVAFSDLCDELEVCPEPGGTDTVSLTGEEKGELVGENLVLKTVAMFRKRVRQVPPLRMVLKKNIPVAAGLGGGSSDAAAILRYLSLGCGLHPMSEPVHTVASALGADVPVCLDPVCRRMTGTGTVLHKPEAAFGEMPVLLINPRVTVATGSVFARLAESGAYTDAEMVEADHAADIKGGKNDLEAPAISIAKEIGTVLAVLRADPQVKSAHLSGSGATCFAHFKSQSDRDRFHKNLRAQYPDWWTFGGSLRNWSASDLVDES